MEFSTDMKTRYRMRGDVTRLTDADLLQKYENAPAGETGGPEDPSRVWTRMLAHEINLRKLSF